MEVIIKGSPEEIAALVVGLQERQIPSMDDERDIKNVAQAIYDRLQEVRGRSENCGRDPGTCLSFLESLMAPSKQSDPHG